MEGYRPQGIPECVKIAQTVTASSADRAESHPAVPHADVADVLAAIAADTSASRQAASQALRFVVLTAARGAEVQQKRWADVDRSTATWTLPPETHEKRKAHRVPLSSAALDVLTEARKLSDGDGLVFVSSAGKGQGAGQQCATPDHAPAGRAGRERQAGDRARLSVQLSGLVR